jgi:regulator of protease activity HflC (stomatin/prohibitin superfamily)
MRKLVVVAALCALSAACGAVSPNAGQVGVLVRKPWVFGHGGVDKTPVTTGNTYVALSTSVVYVNVLPQQEDVEFDDLSTSNGVALDFSTAVQYRITDAPKMVAEFGVDDKWFDRTLERAYRDAVRDAVKRREMAMVAYDAATGDQIDAEVTKAMEAIIAAKGVPIQLIDVSLGRANPPDAIKKQREDQAAYVLRQTYQEAARGSGGLRPAADLRAGAQEGRGPAQAGRGEPGGGRPRLQPEDGP